MRPRRSAPGSRKYTRGTVQVARTAREEALLIQDGDGVGEEKKSPDEVAEESRETGRRVSLEKRGGWAGDTRSHPTPRPMAVKTRTGEERCEGKCTRRERRDGLESESMAVVTVGAGLVVSSPGREGEQGERARAAGPSTRPHTTTTSPRLFSNHQLPSSPSSHHDLHRHGLRSLRLDILSRRPHLPGTPLLARWRSFIPSRVHSMLIDPLSPLGGVRRQDSRRLWVSLPSSLFLLSLQLTRVFPRLQHRARHSHKDGRHPGL